MALESNIYGLWAAKQTAKGTPIAGVAATKRFIQVAGDFTVNRADGQEGWSDLDRFGNMTDFVDTLTGSGNPGIEAQPQSLAYICWLYFGQETVTGAADPYAHLYTPGTNGGFWSTWWKRLGQNTILRQKFNDCRISSLAIEGSTGARVVRVTPTILSLDAGEVYTTPDPSTAFGPDKPFLYHEGQGTYTVNGVVLNGHSQFSATWDEGLAPYYGDDVVPVDLVTGNASIAIAVTVLVDANGLARYNERIYGSSAPAAGTKPLHNLDPLGTYTFTITKKDASGPLSPTRAFTLAFPANGIKWAPDVAIAPNPDGGAVELAMAGAMRKVTGQPASSITVTNGEAAYTA